MKIKLFTVPNIITLFNLLCGCAAIVFALGFSLQTAFWLIIAAAIFDFLDGFFARLLKQYSPLGVQLDSLADMVSFGVAPSAILFSMYNMAGGIGYYAFIAFVLAAFSALRLAKFNIDDRQHYGFIGMPTPAAALFCASIGYLMEAGVYTIAPGYVLVTAVILSYFLVSNIPMFALKFTDYSFKGNKLRYIFLICSIVGLAFMGVAAIPLIILAYLLVSVVSKLVCVK